MRVLIITHAYAPQVNPRTFRWATLAEHWAKAGHELTVLAAWQPDWAHGETLRGVEVHRVGGAWSQNLRHWLRPRQRAETTVDGASPRQGRRCGWREGLKWLHDATWRRLYWPDYACEWYWPAVRKARQLWRSRPYDALLSVSDPFTGHVIGWRLAACEGIRNWIADVGDPFCFLYRKLVRGLPLYHWLDHACERRIYRRAKAVAFTTEGTRRRYAELFPESAGKMHVIPPVVPPITPSHAPPQPFSEDARIRLVYTGSFYAGIRTPEVLLQFFDRLRSTSLGERLELHVYGDVTDYQAYFSPYQHWLGKQLFLHGQVPRPEALRACCEAQAIVNVGNATWYQLPSKIVEYMQLRRPILNLASIANDSSAELLRDYPLALCVETQRLDSAEELQRVTQFLSSPPSISAERAESHTARFRVPVIARAYETLLMEQACSTDRRAA